MLSRPAAPSWPFFFQAEDGIRDRSPSRGLGDVYKRQVFTMYDVRTNLSNQVVENVRTNLDTKIYDTLIPRNIRLAEAPSHGLPINMYDTKSAGAESYRMLAKEVMERKNV